MPWVQNTEPPSDDVVGDQSSSHEQRRHSHSWLISYGGPSNVGVRTGTGNHRPNRETAQQANRAEQEPADEALSADEFIAKRVAQHDFTAWRRIVGYTFASTIMLVLASIGLFQYAFTETSVWLYGGVILGIASIAFRVAGGYTLYKDTRDIAEFTREIREHPQTSWKVGWEPSTTAWTVGYILTPPFAIYGVLTTYLLRRHLRV